MVRASKILLVITTMQNRTLSTAFRLCLDAVAHGACPRMGRNPQDRAASLSHQRKLVLGVKMMENKNESEINVVRDLIELLDLTGVVFTFDALHCQKKPYQRSLIQVMTT